MPSHRGDEKSDSGTRNSSPLVRAINRYIGVLVRCTILVLIGFISNRRLRKFNFVVVFDNQE